jgi:hypothetical protein
MMMRKGILLIAVLFIYDAMAKSSIRGCNSSQVRSIRNVHLQVAKRLKDLTDPKTGIAQWDYLTLQREVLTPMKRIPNPKYRNPVSTYRQFHRKASQVLYSMDRKLKTGFTYQCSSTRSRHCRNGTYAYVLFNWRNQPYNSIYFCPMYFRTTTLDQVDTLQHELSHLAASTDHYLGSNRTDAGIIKGANDAYFYGRLEAAHLEKQLKLAAWGFLWVPE